MTLRVIFEILPHGDELAMYRIGELLIHNERDHGFGYCSYYGKLKKYTNFGDEKPEEIEFSDVMHSRQDGFASLTEKVLTHLNNKENAPD